MTNKNWFYAAQVCVGISILSLFTSIITYKANGREYTFTIIDLLGDTKQFDRIVVNGYRGPVHWQINGAVTQVLLAVAIIGILLAVIGLFTLRAQRPNTWQFILTVLGLLGVAFPSCVLLMCVFKYGKYYKGVLGFGVSPVITPIAMLICILVVIRRKNRVAEELRKEVEAKGLIRKAGDL